MAITLNKSQIAMVKKIIIYFFVLVIAVVMPIYLQSVEDGYERQYKWLNNDTIEITHKLDGLNKKTIEFSDAVKKWEVLSDDDRKLGGLRINESKELLENLQKKYTLYDVKTSFSKPGELVKEHKTGAVSVYSSIVSISFNALSDEYVYNFIAEITNKFPGIVQIKSFILNKPSAITKELLKKISIDENASVVSASLDFYWHDLQSKEGKSSAEVGEPMK